MVGDAEYIIQKRFNKMKIADKNKSWSEGWIVVLNEDCLFSNVRTLMRETWLVFLCHKRLKWVQLIKKKNW
jgi:hypothetical protein